jgi:hypothetical protein
MTNRRQFLEALGAAALTPKVAAQAAPTTRWQQSADRKHELTRDIVWPSHEPLAFLLRRGDHFDDEAAKYEAMHDPASIHKMASAGVKWARFHFYKGFGLEYERPDMEKTRRAAELMHQLGMKVSVYMAGTMFTETLYREVPEARNWEQRDQHDQWVPYGIQTYRHYACPNEPAYRDYLKRILRVAIEEIHTDEIAFDNIMLQAEPKSCRCPRCQRAFHAFLARRYPTKEAAFRRFGLNDSAWVKPNEWDTPEQAASLAVLNDPVLQEWTRFRCESLAHYANDLHDYVKKLNPDVNVHFNIKGLYSYNRYWTNAIYHPLFAGHIDVMSFDTGGYDARIDKTGALVSQIRSYKMARRMAISCEEGLRDELQAAVHLAFGYQNHVKGYAGAPSIGGAYNVFTPILEFFREYNDRYYRGTDNVADVATLRTWASMAYSISATAVPATLMEQVLIQYKVPFDVLFEEQIDSIGKYAAVILAGQECLSNAQVAKLLEYARNGGRLVIAGNTGQYNEWRERRRVSPWDSAPVVSIPQIVRADVRARAAGGEEDAEPGFTVRRGERLSPPQWLLPKNHADIYKAVADGLPRGLSITSEAPVTMVVELLKRSESRETIAHFVNFDRGKAVGAFRASLRAQFEGAVKSVKCFSPDFDEAKALKFEESGGRVSFSVPEMRVYSMIVVG